MFVLASWKKGAFEWWEKLTPIVYTNGVRNVYRGQLDVSYIAEAESLADAKIKLEVGASEFRNVNRGRGIQAEGLTSGDQTAIRRTASKLVGQLSDEAVEFLVVSGGLVPCNTPAARRFQLMTRILNGRLTSAPRHDKLEICGN